MTLEAIYRFVKPIEFDKGTHESCILLNKGTQFKMERVSLATGRVVRPNYTPVRYSLFSNLDSLLGLEKQIPQKMIQGYQNCILT